MGFNSAFKGLMSTSVLLETKLSGREANQTSPSSADVKDK